MEIQKFTNNATTSADMLRKYQDMIVENQGDEDLEEAENEEEEVDESKEEEVEESKEEEVDESTEEEVEESTHFSLSQVNNASILRKYQDILKEVSTSDLEALEKEARDADSFDAAYAKMFGDETDDPNSGMLDTFWRSDAEVLSDKKKRYAAELRRRGTDDFGDITTNPQVLQKNKDDKLRDRLARAGYNQDPNKRPSTTKTIASTGLDNTLQYTPGSKEGGNYKAPASTTTPQTPPPSPQAGSSPVQEPTVRTPQTPPAFPPDPKPNKPTRQQPQTPPDPSAYVDSWRKSTKKKTTPLDVQLSDR